MKIPSIKDIFKKGIPIICLSLGGVYTVFGIFSLLMIKMQSKMHIQQPNGGSSNYLSTLHDIWIVYMPLMALIGICYILFGLYFEKIKINKFKINLVLSICSLLWVVAYSISFYKNKDALFNMPNEIEVFKTIAYVFAIFGFLALLALFTVPQYIIGRKIKKLEA